MVPKTISIETIQYTIPTYYITLAVPFLTYNVSAKEKRRNCNQMCDYQKLCNKIDNHMNDLEQ